MTSALTVDRVVKRFGPTPVLDGVSLAMAPGELIAILGNSGSGKTTLLRLICGFERCDGGAIAIAGRTVSGERLHLPPERRAVGYMAQDGALFPHLSVAGNVLFGLPRAERREERAAALLERAGLPAHFARRAPHLLSGGEQQRVSLARALAPSPKLVLLDEPFSALDAALRKENRLAVAASLVQSGTAAILVTHDQAEALSLGHRVGVLREGRLVQFDTPAALYHRPVDLPLARFLGEANVIAGEAAEAEASCCLGRVGLVTATHGPVQVMLRPEQLRLTPGGAARVCSALFSGAQVMVELDLGGVHLSAAVPSVEAPAAGSLVGIEVRGPAMAYPTASAAPARPTETGSGR